MLEIDNCAYLNNIKDVNPLIKLGITFIGVIASMLTQNANIHILIMLFMTALILFIARVDMKLYRYLHVRSRRQRQMCIRDRFIS